MLKVKCLICGKVITGVKKYDEVFTYCCKCFRVIEKEEKRKKELELKNWYKPGMTDDEYYNKIYNLFC